MLVVGGRCDVGVDVVCLGSVDWEERAALVCSECVPHWKGEGV